MLEPALILWIIGAPLILAIVELIRTGRAMRGSGYSKRGRWSEVLKVDLPAAMPGGCGRT